VDRTKIEWTDATWNPIRGCSPVSEGCRNCYAARVAHRFSGPGKPYEGLADWRGGRAVFNGTIRIVESALDQPPRWKRPRRIFVNSMSDLFHENVPLKVVGRVFSTMISAHRHTFQVLTKRPDRMLEFMLRWTAESERKGLRPADNVWLGVSVEDQKAADERIPLLLQCPAAVRFLSCEPLLGPVDLKLDFATVRDLATNNPNPASVEWVIAGGESGPGARPMHPDWARSLRDQCAAAGVPFFFKQWGDKPPEEAFTSVPHVNALMHAKHCGRLLDGRTHDEFPNNKE